VTKDPGDIVVGGGADWDIYRMSPMGTSIVNLTNSPELDRSPAWSPDHRRIAFYSSREPSGVWIMNADGSGRRPVLPHLEASHITWSPDGRRLVVQAPRLDSGWELYVVNDDGSDPHPLTNTPWSEVAPAWSPDGRQIAFASDQISYADIYVMSSDGGAPRNLTADLGPNPRELDPAWSPDGRTIAFARYFDDGAQIWMMDVNGGNRRPLFGTKAGYYGSLSWSRDGSELVFEVADELGIRVGFVRADGMGVRSLAPEGVRPATEPSW
jgi:TolB protein